MYIICFYLYLFKFNSKLRWSFNQS